MGAVVVADALGEDDAQQKEQQISRAVNNECAGIQGLRERIAPILFCCSMSIAVRSCQFLQTLPVNYRSCNLEVRIELARR